MALFGTRASVSLDASLLSGRAWPRALGGGDPGPALRVPLEPGALLPSATDANLARPATVKAALQELLGLLGRPPRVIAVLPLGIARLSLLEPPAGTDPREYARYRLGPGLPFPAEEAIVDAVSVGAGRVLAGAVRRRVVAEYEELFAACGTTAERVDLAPLAAIEARRRQEPPRRWTSSWVTSPSPWPYHEGGGLTLLPLPPARPGAGRPRSARASGGRRGPRRGRPGDPARDGVRGGATPRW